MTHQVRASLFSISPTHKKRNAFQLEHLLVHDAVIFPYTVTNKQNRAIIIALKKKTPDCAT